MPLRGRTGQACLDRGQAALAVVVVPRRVTGMTCEGPVRETRGVLANWGGRNADSEPGRRGGEPRCVNRLIINPISVTAQRHHNVIVRRQRSSRLGSARTAHLWELAVSWASHQNYGCEPVRARACASPGRTCMFYRSNSTCVGPAVLPNSSLAPHRP